MNEGQYGHPALGLTGGGHQLRLAGTPLPHGSEHELVRVLPREVRLGEVRLEVLLEALLRPELHVSRVAAEAERLADVVEHLKDGLAGYRDQHVSPRYPRELAHGGQGIAEMLENLAAHHQVEAVILERELEDAADVEVGRIGEAAPGEGHDLVRRINARDADARVAFGDEVGDEALAATCVEQRAGFAGGHQLVEGVVEGRGMPAVEAAARGVPVQVRGPVLSVIDRVGVGRLVAAEDVRKGSGCRGRSGGIVGAAEVGLSLLDQRPTGEWVRGEAGSVRKRRRESSPDVSPLPVADSGWETPACVGSGAATLPRPEASMTTIWTVLVTALAGVLAVAASLHAIMTRREVGTAVAWVGVILLSPIVGAVVYFLLGVNRIKRRARELRGGDVDTYLAALPPPVSLDVVHTRLAPGHEHLVQIARLVDTVTGRPLLPGNRVETLVNGDEAYPAMIAAIDAAEHSVGLLTYIFDNDRAGKRFLDALHAAQERGVEVRVLIDDVGARYSFPSTVRALRRAGIRVARFMPALFHWRMPYFNLRNHRKIMVVDGTIGFTGGMNIREGYWHQLTGEKQGADVHFQITGPAVAELQEVFAQDWTFTTGERLLGEAWFPQLEPVGDTIARGISDGPDIDFEKLHSTILGAIAVARRTVSIVTPYFVPDQRLLSSLVVAARRGVVVTIVLPERVNLILVEWASKTYWGELLEAGCRIVVTPPPFDHTKLMVVDRGWCLLGSTNMDPRSLQLNFEFNVECYDPDLATRIDRFVQRRREIGREVTLAEVRERPFHVRLRNRLARLLSPYL
jgi:cardiolipin synthase A/B